MRVIWKYVFGSDVLRVDRPGVVRHVGIDPVTRRPAVWVEHTDRDHLGTPPVFALFATGQEFPDGYVFEGSVIDADHGLVWHVHRDPLL